MNPQTITCPGCNSRYQTKAAPGKQLACPKCKTVLTIPAPQVDLGSSSDPLGIGALESSAPQTRWANAPAGPSAAPRTLPSGGFGAKGSAVKGGGKLSVDPRLLPFLKRLAIGHAVGCGLIVLLGAIGWFSEAVALGSAFLGIVIMVGVLAAGRIWLIVIAFGRSPGLGVATLFVPLMWTYLLAKRIGKSQLAVTLMVSALIPAIVTLGMISVLRPKYDPGSSAASRRSRMAAKADDFASTVLKREAANPPTGQPKQAVFRYVLRIENPSKVLSDGDRGLGQFAGYVKGSLVLNETERTISFEHRGSPQLESMYRLYLASKTGVTISP